MKAQTLVLLLVLLVVSNAANIIVAVVGERGHFAPMIAIAQKLSKKHKITFISHDNSLPWLKEADYTSYSINYVSMGKNFFEEISNYTLSESEVKQRFTQSDPTIAVAAASDTHVYQFRSMEKIFASEQFSTENVDLMIVDISTSGVMSFAQSRGIPYFVNIPILAEATGSSQWIPYYLPVLSKEGSIVPSNRSEVTALLLRFAKRCADVGLHFGINLAEKMAVMLINKARQKLGLPWIWNMNDLFAKSIVFIDSNLGFDYARHVTPNVQFVGPLIPTLSNSKKDGDNQDIIDWVSSRTKPVVYVSMGSWSPLTDSQIQDLSQVFAATQDQFDYLWSLKPSASSNISLEFTSNVKVASWVPQIEVLKNPNVKVFISHCGMNSVQESIMEGKPLLCIPLFADQPATSFHVEGTNVGLVEMSTANKDHIIVKLRQIVDNESKFRASLEHMKKLAQYAGGLNHVEKMVDMALDVGFAHLLPHSVNLPWYLDSLPYYTVMVVIAVSFIFAKKVCACCLCCRCCRKAAKAKKD